MDESWRMHMGHNLPRRRSTEETSSDRMRRSVFGVNSSESETLNPDDFNDVFGGPPRSVIYRKLSCDLANNRSSSSTSPFYEGVFQSSKFVDPTKEVGRNLPVFRIPSMSLSSATREGVSRTTTDTDDDGFYNDIFGSDEDRRSKSNSNWKSKSKSKSKSQSKSKSKSNSSSVLSSEDLSPLRPSIAEDVFFSSFSSKLRPINVGRNSSSTLNREQQNIHRTSDAPWPRPPFTAFQYMDNDQNENYKSSKFGFSRSGSSPETISLDPNSYQSIKVSMDDLETDSPSSVISSSLCRDPENKTKVQDKALQEEEEEEEVMGSYVIEITSERMDESVDIDEAIAWAKEKFQTQSLESMDGGNQKQNMSQTATEPELEPFAEREERYISDDHLEEQRGGDGRMQFLVANEQLMRWKIEEPQQSEKDMEMELLEETIRLWSAGRDGNIRLLLSTLHNILWPSSGWYAIPLTNLLETSDVKKAYQKARLCLHPDKIQQRGATLPQKYVAEKAFAILQDAWASFISQDILG